ncbi:Rv3235 family protein [Rothia kristinae]|uniref:Uncharacterized protein n=1 Tax=Rothia kristinae TaxID=37923 RepID=A0A1S2N3K9_9MICC|nr:Rv3235 family protein [Rothia kristinae]OIJ36440.1 hypothetical protein BK826_03225 [Rothia kristinae]QQC59307.1 hypothetical protein I6H58_10275 [Rothia kristinae]
MSATQLPAPTISPRTTAPMPGVPRTGTVLSIRSVPGTPGAHPAGPPPYYQWRRRTVDPEEELRRVHAIAGAVGAAIAEVVAGRRQLHQLSRWVHPMIMHRIRERRDLEAGTPVAPSPTIVALDQAPRGSRFSSPARPQRVRAVCAAPDEYEAAVVVRVEDRCRAMALRIHRVRGQWQIVAAEIG